MERFITLTFLAPIRVFRIVCIRVQWNHSELAGVPPGVGSEYGHFGVLGVGSEYA